MFAATSGLEQVVIGVIIGLVVVLVPLAVRFLWMLVRDVHDIKDVLITPKPTLLVPNPTKGLIDNVALLMSTAGATLLGTKALIEDKAPNDGSSMRDAIDRIEVEQARHDPEAPQTPSHP